MECHNSTPATLTTLAHNDHLNPVVSYGRAIGCADCHAAATVNTHANGTVDFGGTVTLTYGTGPESVVAAGGRHVRQLRDEQLPPGRRWRTRHGAGARGLRWNTALTDDCASCHLGAMATNKHAQHTGSNSLPAALTFNARTTAWRATAPARTGRARRRERSTWTSRRRPT